MSDNKTFIAARKKYIGDYFKNLNDMQKQAVLCTKGPLLILAGAGSGKTTVLVNRVINLLKFGNGSDSDEVFGSPDPSVFATRCEEADKAAAVNPVKPYKMLAITFTNKAANELKNRLETAIGPEALDIWACTFHSACVRILRRDAEVLGYNSSFTIYDTSDTQTLVKSILKDLNLDDKTFAPRAVLSEISRAKDAYLTPGQYAQEVNKGYDKYKKTVAEIYSRYQSALFSASAMDFDDLLFNVVKLLKEHPDAREYWQNHFDYVMIDEYQDTNRLQYWFASLITNDRNNICVVGDDDQSIYKFRGATIENILNFESQFKSCRTIRLEENYRSTSHILEAANSIIANNTARKGKNLWTAKIGGDPVELYVANNENEEARYVLNNILTDIRNGGSWNNHAVLYRMNAQSNVIERILSANSIPYKVMGGMRFFDRAEVKDILAYLCVISTPSDDLRLGRIINKPARGIGPRTIQIIEDIAAESRSPMFDVIARCKIYPELDKASAKLTAFADIINYLREFSSNHPLDELFDEVLEKTGYMQELAEKDTLENRTKAENVNELKSSIISYLKENENGSLGDYLSGVALYSDLDNYSESDSYVALMTMHSAKGLEFENVYVIGMDETIFPNSRAIGEQEEMEEERRLCYVAVTRAKKRLFLISARERMLFGRTTSNRVSRFVEEIPEKNIVKKNVRRDSMYSAPSASSPRTGTFNRGYGISPKKTDYFSPKITPSPQPATTNQISFDIGTKVNHKAFGKGTVIGKTPMGGDFLLEVQFDLLGKKKLMQKAASVYMKIEE